MNQIGSHIALHLIRIPPGLSWLGTCVIAWKLQASIFGTRPGSPFDIRDRGTQRYPK